MRGARRRDAAASRTGAHAAAAPAQPRARVLGDAARASARRQPRIAAMRGYRGASAARGASHANAIGALDAGVADRRGAKLARSAASAVIEARGLLAPPRRDGRAAPAARSCRRRASPRRRPRSPATVARHRDLRVGAACLCPLSRARAAERSVAAPSRDGRRLARPIDAAS
ncbi:MAG: hypothetical protein HS111_13005 [Kofleriaceae bacterium]|nr:hypothetical protein [Kofleriaceae bacterium]